MPKFKPPYDYERPEIDMRGKGTVTLAHLPLEEANYLRYLYKTRRRNGVDLFTVRETVKRSMLLRSVA